jgi:hypothetical protein
VVTGAHGCHAPEQVDGARGQSRRGIHQAATAADSARGAGDAEVSTTVAKGRDRLPLWWLFFLPLYWFPQGINFGLIQTYLLCVLAYPARLFVAQVPRC